MRSQFDNAAARRSSAIASRAAEISQVSKRCTQTVVNIPTLEAPHRDGICAGVIFQFDKNGNRELPSTATRQTCVHCGRRSTGKQTNASADRPVRCGTLLSESLACVQSVENVRHRMRAPPTINAFLQPAAETRRLWLPHCRANRPRPNCNDLTAAHSQRCCGTKSNRAVPSSPSLTFSSFIPEYVGKSPVRRCFPHIAAFRDNVHAVTRSLALPRRFQSRHLTWSQIVFAVN